jgi:putative ABC transport system permease protein
MTRAVFQALIGHWRRHLVQLISLLAGLALATALWTGVQAINAQARQSYDQAAGLVQQNQFDRLLATNGGTVDQARYIALRRAGWLVSPVVSEQVETSDGPIRVLGIDPVTAPVAAQPAQIQRDDFDLSAFFARDGVVFAAPDVTERAAARFPDLRVIEDAQVPPNTVLMDVGVAQGALNLGARLSYLIVLPEQPAGLLPLSDIAPDLRLRAGEQGTDIARLTDSFHLNLTAFGLLSFAVGLFIVHSSIGLAFEQRRTTFRTLRAIGVPLRTLFAVLVAEVLVLALIAGAVGVVLGYGIAATLLPDVAATLRGLYGASVGGVLALPPIWWLGGIAIAVLGTLVAAAQSLWRLARLPILAAAKPRAWGHAGPRAWMMPVGAAVGLAVVGAVALRVLPGIAGGFVLLGAGMIAAAILLPVVLAIALHLISGRARAPMAHWFWADTRQQLPGLSLALMALMLALAVNVGVGTMVSSFRQTFTGWLDQRLASELYVTAPSAEAAEDLRAWMAARDDIDAALPIWSVEGTLNGAPGQVFGVADHATYRDNWPMLALAPDGWDRLAAGQGVLINEQMYRRDDLDLGDLVSLPDGTQMPVIGVYSDYGNPLGQAMIGIDALTARFPNVERLRYALRVDAEQAGAIRAALLRDLDWPEDAVNNQAVVKRVSLQIFERTFQVTAALNILTLGVAAVAMFMSLLTLSSMRLPQVAPVWAVGTTRRDLARLEVLRSAILALFTMVYALPVGLGLAWGLLAVVNVAAFGWKLPMFLFPSDWAWLAIWAVLAGVAAAAWPAWRMSRISPSDLLKVFANER